MNQKKTICHIITSLSTGGAEMMLYKLLASTNRQETNHVVISLMDKGTLGHQIENFDIKIYTLNMHSVISFPHAVLKLRKLMRMIRPNIVQGWMYHGNLMANICVLFSTKGTKLIWGIRQSLGSYKFNKFGTRLLIRLGRYLSDYPDIILYNSQTSAKQHEQYGYNKEKTIVIPNGFNIEVFKPKSETRNSLRNELGLNHETLVIGLIGRYHPVKGHNLFLESASQLLKSLPNVHFILVGREVNDKNIKLIKHINRLGIMENVHLMDERNDVAFINSALDVANSTSLSEAFSNAIGEAMACGIPCVVTDVGDSALLVGETGIVIPPGSIDSLVEAWKLLIANPEERARLGIIARERINELYSIQSITKQYEDLYKDI